MNTDKFIFTGLLGVLLPALSVKAQESNKGTATRQPAKWHVELDIQRYIAFREQIHGYSTNERYNTTGAALTLLYALNPKLQVGAGVAAAQNGIPLYAALCCHPFGMTGWKDGYAYTQLGYAPFSGDGSLNKGVYWSMGIGYTKMFRRHFGLNFQAGYQLRDWQDMQVYHFVAGPDGSWGMEDAGTTNALIHSFTFGVGLVF